jgi:hypothetical protein
MNKFLKAGFKCTSCLYRKAQGLSKELTMKIDETQVELQAVKTSFDTQMKSLADMRNDFHKVLQTTKADIRINQERMEAKIEATGHEFQKQLKEVEAGAKHGRGTGTSMGKEKPPKFKGTTQWVGFQHQFQTVAKHDCWTHLKKSIYLIIALQGWAINVLH